MSEEEQEVLDDFTEGEISPLETWQDYLIGLLEDDLGDMAEGILPLFEDIGRGMARAMPSAPALEDRQIEALREVAKKHLPEIDEWLVAGLSPEEAFDQWTNALDKALRGSEMMAEARALFRVWRLAELSDDSIESLMADINSFSLLSPADARAISWAEEMLFGFRASYRGEGGFIQGLVRSARQVAEEQAARGPGRPSNAVYDTIDRMVLRGASQQEAFAWARKELGWDTKGVPEEVQRDRLKKALQYRRAKREQAGGKGT